MSTNEHLLKYQWPLEYLIWYWYWYDAVWNGRVLYLDCYSQFIVTQKPWRSICVYIFMLLATEIYSSHLISSPIRSFNWLIYASGERLKHSVQHSRTQLICVKTVRVIHSCIHSWYRAAQKSIWWWVHVWSHQIVIAFYMRFKSETISIQVHTRACKQNHPALFIDVNSIICLRMEMSRLHQF